MKHLPFSIVLLSAFGAAVASEPVQTQEIEVTGVSSANVKWDSVSQRSYFLQWSTDMVNWSYFPFVEYGDGIPEISYGFDASGSDKMFVRLKYLDVAVADAETADFDGDGWGNLFELQTLQTDPLQRDTSGNGQADGSASNDGDAFPDAWEMLHFGNLTTLKAADADSDLDGDGVSNAFEAQMRTDPNSNDSSAVSDRENFTYTSIGQITTTSGAQSASFLFDDESNLNSAQ